MVCVGYFLDKAASFFKEVQLSGSGSGPKSQEIKVAEGSLCNIKCGGNFNLCGRLSCRYFVFFCLRISGSRCLWISSNGSLHDILSCYFIARFLLLACRFRLAEVKTIELTDQFVNPTLFSELAEAGALELFKEGHH